MKNKTKPCTIGELQDFLLRKEFSRDDEIIIETLSTEKKCYDIGISNSSSEGRKLIISMRK